MVSINVFFFFLAKFHHLATPKKNSLAPLVRCFSFIYLFIYLFIKISDATNTKDFCEKNVPKLRIYFLWNASYLDNRFQDSGILNIFHFSNTHYNHIWLFPLWNDHQCGCITINKFTMCKILWGHFEKRNSHKKHCLKCLCYFFIYLFIFCCPWYSTSIIG
jgi:hypothetical protein